MFGGVRVFRGVRLWGYFWVRPDKNDPKCNMGFDSDTFTKKMLKTAENDVWTKIR